MIVMKFGGSSVAGVEAMGRTASIIKEHVQLRPVVVLSAMAKTTDRLLECARAAASGNSAEMRRLLDVMRDDHARTATGCVPGPAGKALTQEIQAVFAELENLLRDLSVKRAISGSGLDEVAGFGERLSTTILVHLLRYLGLKAELLDSRELIKTDSDFTRAAPDYEATEVRLRASIPPLVKAGRIPVLQGFVGSDQNGTPTTLGRNGSDFSAAIVGALLGADEIQIWTDVAGILSADPSLIRDARKVKYISFAEASELAYFGAKVLHPSTILPAVKRNVPVRVLNSRDPGGSGTLITSDGRAGKNPIKSIAYKAGIVTLNIASDRMLMAHGFLKRLFEIFERHGRPVDMVATSEVSVSLTLDSDQGLEPLLQDLRAIGEVSVARNKAIICLVGENLKFTPGIAARAFRAIDPVNIQMISQGASVINLGFVVDAEHVSDVVRRLHSEFFSELDLEIFE